MDFYITNNVLKKYIPNEEITQAVVPTGVTEIQSYAFDDFFSIDQVHLMPDLVLMGYRERNKSSSLVSIVIPESVSIISKVAFIECDSLEYINVNPKNEFFASVDGMLFDKKLERLICCPGGKTSVTVPEGVTTIDEYAFYACRKIKSLTLPDSLRKISKRAFMACGFEHITLPEGVASICEWAFTDCDQLESITLPESAVKLGSYIFPCCTSLKRIDVKSRVTEIKKFIGGGCDSLKEITLPEGLQKICYGAFQDQTALEYINIPQSLEKIEREAFQGCVRLKNVTLPEGLRDLGCRAFEGCVSLTKVTVPQGVEKIGDRCFIGCTSLNELNIFGYTVNNNDWNWEFYSPDKVRDMLANKDYFSIFGIPINYSIALQVFLRTGQHEAEDFIKKYFSQVIVHVFKSERLDLLKGILDSGIFVNERNIFALINYAIKHTQKGGDPQMQLILTNYRMEHFPDLDPLLL